MQLREKDLAPARLLRLACRLRKVIAGRALLIVNGPLEVALAAGADGVHLPEGAPPLVARDAGAGPWGLLVGRSVHSLESARRAAAEGARYVIAGPVYDTRSHAGTPAAGTAIIESVAAAVPVPVIGIGGITYSNAVDVMAAGASGIAVISAILAVPDCENAARDLRGVLNAAWSVKQATP